jgi:hypothetical protein
MISVLKYLSTHFQRGLNKTQVYLIVFVFCDMLFLVFLRVVMDILEDFKIIEGIKDINKLEELYTFNDLKMLYIKTQKLDIENNKLFEKILNENIIKEDLQKVWKDKNNIQKFNSILLKALVTIERNKLLLKTEEITKNLTNVIENID